MTFRQIPSSADNPARRLGEEVFKHRQLGLRFGAAEDVGFGFFKRDAAVVDGFVHIFDSGDLLGGEAVAAHAFAVDACGFCAVACRHEVRRYVFVYACSEGGHGVVTDLAELEHQRVAAQDDVVADYINLINFLAVYNYWFYQNNYQVFQLWDLFPYYALHLLTNRK